MYIGSVNAVTEDVWVVQRGRIVKRQGTRIPGLLKLFDEILVNAADNRQRDAATSHVLVSVNKKTGEVMIENDGRGIPVEKHEKEDMYIPELVLGNLLTGSNFTDDGGLTGGRHGYGAKLTNIFSKSFTIDTADAARGLRYTQRWEQNMTTVHPPVIEKLPRGATSYTRVSFVPDFKRFGVKAWPADTLAEMERRSWDVAACNPGLQVHWNGSPVGVASWEEYVSLLAAKPAAGALNTVLTTSGGPRWNVGVMLSPSGQFEQVSFVNSMCTSRGGTHVNAVTDTIVSLLHDALTKKHKALGITKKAIKSNLCVAVSALIENPEFDSQAKEQLTSKPQAFGSTCEFSRAFTQELTKHAPIVDAILRDSHSSQLAALSRVAKVRSKKDALLDVEKLEDANQAGTRRSQDCTLILTEGDSAKALAMAGISEVGRDTFGVLPLKGKMLNVRDAPLATIKKNAELVSLIRVLGLDFKRAYAGSDSAGLRYGRVLIMTDQDQDGSHIKGLVLNMFHHFWPNLVTRPGFLAEFVTPLLKARKGKKTIGFFTMNEYEDWWATVPRSDRPKWTTKYYKGLGTSTALEGREYFRNLDRHIIEFTCSSLDEANILDLPFSKKRAADRKSWMLEHGLSGNVVDHGSPKLSLTDFVNKELVHFSQMDLLRSIPSAVDGMKPSQRKVLYAASKRAANREMKVAQLAGFCAETTAYHHGEASLHATIVNMAQDFVGSNNLPLLQPIGQFGTRLQGGKDAASPRYIFTQLSPLTELIFRPEDECVLRWRYDDGMRIEPEAYLPIIPMALVNGAEGIGTGWSTSIPPHNPVDVIDALLTRIDQGADAPNTAATWKSVPKLQPWFRGFKGTVTRPRAQKGKRTSTAFQAMGCCSILSRQSGRSKSWVDVEVSELPAKVWTEDYRAYLGKQVAAGTVLGFEEHHTDREVRFVIQVDEEALGKRLRTPADAAAALRLSTSVSTSNVHLIGTDSRVINFDSADSVLRHFFRARHPLYDARRDVQSAVLDARALKLREQSRFVSGVASGEIQLAGNNRDAIHARLSELEFSPQAALRPVIPDELSWVDLVAGGLDTGGSAPSDGSAKHAFDYLLRLPLGSLTDDRRAGLEAQAARATAEAETLRSKTAFELWETDLLVLRHALAEEGTYEAE